MSERWDAATPAGQGTANGDGDHLAVRPTPGLPRPYQFPAFERRRLTGGLELIFVDVPGRPLVSAELVVRRGAGDEAATAGGATVLAARALSEGTSRYDAVAFVEAAERLGATLHGEASWDGFIASVDVPGARLGPALELLAEMALRPTFPETEVARLRDERLNDLLQARADPRRRADEAFVAAIYTADSPYARPAGGSRDTVSVLDRDVLRAVHGELLAALPATMIVGGDLGGIDVERIVGDLFGGLGADSGAASGAGGTAGQAADEGEATVEPVRSAVEGTFVRLVDRPGSVQTEIRIGHMGLPRRVPDFHAVQVMSAILGGLFNSRLNMKLREEKGYTYGAGAGFDMRRWAGPFSARTAVNSEVTAAAVTETLGELRRIRDERVTDAELDAARDFLVGVFPLRFETPGAVVGALSGIVVHGLPDDELTRYREAVAAVTPEQVRDAAVAHIHPDQLGIVLVGDASRIAGEVEAAGIGPLEIVRDAPDEGASPDAPGAVG